MIGRFGILNPGERGGLAPSSGEPGLREYAQPDVKAALLGFYVPNKDRFDAIMQQRSLIADLPNIKNRVINLESRLNQVRNDLDATIKNLSSLTSSFTTVRDLANQAKALVDQLRNDFNTLPGRIQDIADCVFNNGINKTTLVGDRVRTLIGGHRAVFDEVAARVRAGGNGFGWLMKNLGDNIPSGFGTRIKALLTGSATDGFATTDVTWGPGPSGHSVDWTDFFGTAQYATIVWPADKGIGGIARSRVSVARQIIELGHRMHYDMITWNVTDRSKRDSDEQAITATLKNAHNFAASQEAFWMNEYTKFMVDKIVGPIEKMIQDALPHLYDAGGTLAGLPDAIKANLDAVAASAKDLSDGNFGVGPRCVIGGGAGPGPIDGSGATIGGGDGTPNPIPGPNPVAQRYTDEDEDVQPSLM